MKLAAVNRNFLVAILLAVTSLAAIPRATGQATDWKQVPIPPLPAFRREHRLHGVRLR